ncbi:PTS sugar transporter subunit IIB [Selenomonas sp. TAMA-11512]|uniref:PTS sugar transporter subunit IIB n=1 Tax=Selenomonas sp. TAMA-11512 TaxID=3095337 RepID=UPI003089900D|nr:PTS sugar transporter subunit IIB [Selenomonas sp. TAMA-11512]
MRNVVLARVDDRLIHGEVVSVWTPTLSVNRIAVVDDGVAADAFNTRVIKGLAPEGVKCFVWSVATAVEKLKGDPKKDERMMILTKTPITFLRLVEGGIGLKEVNLGGMGLRDARRTFIKNVACDEEEIEAIKRLDARGVRVYYQLVPEQQIIEAMTAV